MAVYIRKSCVQISHSLLVSFLKLLKKLNDPRDMYLSSDRGNKWYLLSFLEM